MAEESMDGKPLKDNLKEAAKAFDKIRTLGSESEDIFKSIGTALTGMARDSKDFKTQIGSASSLQTDLATQAKILASVSRSTITDKKEIAKFESAAVKLGKTRLALNAKITTLQQLRANAGKAEQKILDKTIENLRNGGDYAGEIASNFKEISDANKKLNQDTSWIEGIADVADDLPVVGKFFGDFKRAAQEAREAGAKGGSALAAGGGAVAGAVGKLALAFSGATFLKAIYKTDQDVVNLQRNLNLSESAARSLDKRFREVGITVKGISGDDLRNVTMAVSDQMGATADLSAKSGIALAVMTKKLGLSAEQAASLATFSATTGKNIEDVQKEIVGTVQVQNVANNTSIRYQDIMKDIAGASAATRMSVKGMPGGLAKAAYQARKLGLSFSSMEGIADNLLDYESSIANEMEAELLIGQDLELNGARQAALRNDLVGMSQELAKNGITAAKFSDMDRIQQEAVAKAMGMSREEMAGMFEKQKAIQELGGGADMTVDAAVRKKYEEIQLMDEGAAKEKAMQKLRDTAGAKEITRQLETQSAAEAQEEAMQDMTAALGDFSKLLIPVTAFFQKISTIAGETFVFITKMGSKMKALGAIMRDAFKPLSKLKTIPTLAMKLFGKLGKFLGGSFIKAGAKGGFKSLLKKIPILGALVGLGFAAKRAKEGDYLGAGLEFLSGVASIFPGIGTAVSAGLDVGLMAMDANGVTGKNSKSAIKRRKDPSSFVYEEKDVKLDDFTIRANPKDTITMAGGTKLGGNVENLLQELIHIVKQGGDVYLDGSKVGSALALGAKLST